MLAGDIELSGSHPPPIEAPVGQNQSRFQKSAKPRRCCCCCSTFVTGGPPTKNKELNQWHLRQAHTLDDLNAANPVSTDGLAQSADDDHLRLIKSTIKASFPNITGAMNATHTELNTVAWMEAQQQTSTTLVDADRFVVNDDGTMVQVAMTDLITYIDANNTLR